MATFRTNPSRDVLTPQMREAMYAQLENRMRDQDIADEIRPAIPLPEPVTEPPVPQGRPRRKMIDFPGGLATPADPASAGYEPGQPTMTPDASLDLLQREVDEKLDALPSSPMQGIDSTSTQDPLVDVAMRSTLQWEGRKDRQGNLMVYDLPSGDGGGSYEVAGINNRYHPQAAKEIAALPPEQRAMAAAKYIRAYTAPLVNQLPEEMRPFAQDLAFHRGLGGATRFIQRGLADMGFNIRPDGIIGPKTLAALGQANLREVKKRAVVSYLEGERAKAEANPQRRKFLPGLENRARNLLAAFG
jgi:hypothetical protein